MVIETTEAQIAVHWREEEYYYPSAKFIGQANLTDPSIIERFSEKNFPECFREYADLLSWDQYWHTTLDTSDPPFWKWFVGGKINASYNCVDRHLAKYKNKAALIFVPEPESEAPVSVTYRELYVRVNEFAALLRDFCGLKSGDRVTIHMPMVPELPITMLACARLGVIHSVVFGGFSGEACGMRAADSGSHVLITMDGYYRNGKLIDHKAAADIALDIAKKEGQVVDKVLVWRRHAGQNASASPFVKGRDFWVDEILPNYSGQIVPPVPMDAEAPLFLMYTSGSTGKPKGCQHRTGGYLSYVAGTSKYIQDIHPEDVYWCMADIGWITGHSYIVYGPLALAATSVLYEGVPTYPDAGRVWRIAERLDVNIFHTSPTAIRMLRKSGHDEPTKYNYHFKHMTTVGEPIEPEVWRWYHETVGKGEAVIVDTWWQTENGGFLCSTKPALDPMKPGSAGPGMPGIYPMIYDENNEPACGWVGEGREHLHPESLAGNHADHLGRSRPLRQPVLQRNTARIATARTGATGRILRRTELCWPLTAISGSSGRVDDVINVAGHRLGTKEIESACLTVPEVAEAAVVPVVDEIKGRVPEVYIALQPGIEASPEIIDKVNKVIETMIGKIARPTTDPRRSGYAKNPIRQAHAPRSRRRLQQHEHWRYHDLGQS